MAGGYKIVIVGGKPWEVATRMEALRKCVSDVLGGDLPPVHACDYSAPAAVRVVACGPGGEQGELVAEGADADAAMDCLRTRAKTSAPKPAQPVQHAAVVPTQSSGEGNADGALVKTLMVGDTVVVREDFESDSKAKVTLARGTRGKVKKVDETLAALINFSGVPTNHWVRKQNFVKFSMVAGVTAEEVGFAAGLCIDVLEDFWSNSTPKRLLKRGFHGRVLLVDDNGDAKIDFDDLETNVWVFRRYFGRLKPASR